MARADQKDKPIDEYFRSDVRACFIDGPTLKLLTAKLGAAVHVSRYKQFIDDRIKNAGINYLRRQNMDLAERMRAEELEEEENSTLHAALSRSRRQVLEETLAYEKFLDYLMEDIDSFEPDKTFFYCSNLLRQVAAADRILQQSLAAHPLFVEYEKELESQRVRNAQKTQPGLNCKELIGDAFWTQLEWLHVFVSRKRGVSESADNRFKLLTSGIELFQKRLAIEAQTGRRPPTPEPPPASGGGLFSKLFGGDKKNKDAMPRDPASKTADELQKELLGMVREYRISIETDDMERFMRKIRSMKDDPAPE
jgi:hypothetical protein